MKNLWNENEREKSTYLETILLRLYSVGNSEGMTMKYLWNENEREKSRYLETALFQYHFARHKYRMARAKTQLA
jgi:hypothetical protein